MRSVPGRVAASLVVTLTLLAAPCALAASKKTEAKAKATPSPSPTASAATAAATATPVAAAPTPAATPTPDALDDMPTVTDEPGAVATPKPNEEWDGALRSGGMMMGMRAGVHAFQPGGIAGDGGLALEAVWAMPLSGPWYLGAVGGYHTGFEKAGGGGDSNTRRFFDAEFLAVEGQYRKNAGRVNLMAGVGLGALTGNSAAVTLANGTTGSDSGTGVVAHVTGAAEVQMAGRIGLVAQARYGFAPTPCAKAKATIPMGGLTLGVGFDLGF